MNTTEVREERKPLMVNVEDLPRIVREQRSHLQVEILRLEHLVRKTERERDAWKARAACYREARIKIKSTLARVMRVLTEAEITVEPERPRKKKAVRDE